MTDEQKTTLVRAADAAVNDTDTWIRQAKGLLIAAERAHESAKINQRALLAIVRTPATDIEVRNAIESTAEALETVASVKGLPSKVTERIRAAANAARDAQWATERHIAES